MSVSLFCLRRNITKCLFQDILKDAIENNISSATDLPYFEGDFWPNVLEDSIKELEQEEEEKRKREEAEAAAAEAEATVTTTEGDEVSAVVRFFNLENTSRSFASVHFITLPLKCLVNLYLQL